MKAVLDDAWPAQSQSAASAPESPSRGAHPAAAANGERDPVRLLARALIAPVDTVDALEYYPFSSIQPVCHPEAAALLRSPASRSFVRINLYFSRHPN